jgi:hypothetical protein
MPTAPSSDGSSTSATNDPPTGMRENSISASPSTPSPMTSAAFGPMRPTTFSVAIIIRNMIAIVIGKSARPLANAP